MKIIIILFFSITLLSQQRVVIIGAPVADIVAQLELEDKVIASDDYSQNTFFKKSKNIGYLDSLRPSSISELDPDYIMFIDNGLSKEISNYLKTTAIPNFKFKTAFDQETVLENIKTIGEIFGKEIKANDLVEDAQMKFTELEFKTQLVQNDKKIVFVKRSYEKLKIAGKGTPEDFIIKTIDAENIAGGSGWVDLKNQNMNKADIIIFEKNRFLTEFPKSLYTTKSYKNNKFIVFDSNQLLGISPRVIDLMIKIYETH